VAGDRAAHTFGGSAEPDPASADALRAWRWVRIASAVPKCTEAGVCIPIPECRCSWL
jgi:hypothetical protein